MPHNSDNNIRPPIEPCALPRKHQGETPIGVMKGNTHPRAVTGVQTIGRHAPGMCHCSFETSSRAVHSNSTKSWITNYNGTCMSCKTLHSTRAFCFHGVLSTGSQQHYQTPISPASKCLSSSQPSTHLCTASRYQYRFTLRKVYAVQQQVVW